MSLGETNSENPYAPTEREWAKKSWLYEQYWGHVKTVSEMALMVDVSRQTLHREMQDKGVPRRPPAIHCEDPIEVSKLYKNSNRVRGSESYYNSDESSSRGRKNSPSDENEKLTWDEVADFTD